MPLPRIDRCARLGIGKDLEVLHFLDGDHVPGLQDEQLLRLRPLEGELYLLRVPALVVDQVPADLQQPLIDGLGKRRSRLLFSSRPSISACSTEIG